MHDQAEMPERLSRFLGQHAPELGPVEVLAYEPIVGGYSRLMATATVRWGSNERRLVLRGDPLPGQTAIDTDRAVEWAVVATLGALPADLAVPLPAARWYDATGATLGTKAIVCDHVEGPSLLTHLHDADDTAQRQLALQLADVAAAVHRVPPELLPDALDRPHSWDDYFASLVALWRDAERAHLESDPFMRYVAAWLERHRPPPVPLTLVHGDFQSANLIVDPGGSLSLVDWEFAHIGDPREDLGWFKTVAGAAPPDIVGLDDEAFCAHYRERTGLDEAAVNPLTLAYFAVLSAVHIYTNLLTQNAALSRGASTSLTTAYNTGSQAFAHAVWASATEALEAAFQAMEAAA